MTDEPPEREPEHQPEPMSPAEQRLGDLLGLLATRRPPEDPGFTPATMRRVRVQRAIATPVRAIGQFAAAVVDGLRAILGTGGPRSQA